VTHPSQYLGCLGATLLTVSTSNAQSCGPQWIAAGGSGVRGCSHIVYAATSWDPDGSGPAPPALVIGGAFSNVANLQGARIAKLDGTGWQALGNTVQGNVQTLAVYNGSLIAGTIFSSSIGPSSQSIARWTGSAWASMGNGLGSPPSVLCTYGSELYAGGSFTTSGGAPSSYLARWNGSTWSGVGAGVSGRVHALCVYNGALVVGGTYTSAAGMTVNNIARWNGASWQSLGTGMTGGVPYVTALAVFEGDLIAAGNFSSAGGVPARSVARFDGTSWNAMGAGIPSFVYELVMYEGMLIAAGSSMHRWDGVEWVPFEERPDGLVNVLRVHDGSLFVGGQFFRAGGLAASHVATWNNGWANLGPTTTRDWVGDVFALAEYQEELFAAGNIALADGLPVNNVVAWHGSGWQPVGTGTNGPVNALKVYDNELIAGGEFTRAGNAECPRIARWNGATWAPLGSGLDPGVYALEVHEGELIAAGEFGTPYGTLSSHVAVWRDSGWQPLGERVAPSYELARSGPLLYAGAYNQPFGQARVWEWDGSSWAALGGVVSSFMTTCIAEFNNQLFHGTDLTSPQGIYRWNPTNGLWEAISGGTGQPNGFYRAMKVFDGGLTVGGSFSGPSRNVARWTGSSWQALGTGADGRVSALAEYKGELVIGGRFVRAGDHLSAGIARWSTTAAPWIAEQPRPVNLCGIQTVSFQVTPAVGFTGLTYQWRRNGQILIDGPTGNGSIAEGATAPILTIHNATPADSGSFDCIVSNACGGSSSTSASLGQVTADFNNDGDFGTDQDIEAFFACLAGNCCPLCGSPDFNSDGDVGTDQDIEAFFRVLAGQPC
jgi:trimeric autotransporter adhesin